MVVSVRELHDPTAGDAPGSAVPGTERFGVVPRAGTEHGNWLIVGSMCPWAYRERCGGWKLAHNPALPGCASVALRGVGLLCSSAVKSRICMWGRGRGCGLGSVGPCGAVGCGAVGCGTWGCAAWCTR